MRCLSLIAAFVLFTAPVLANDTFPDNPHYPTQPGSTSTCLAEGASGECKVWAAVQTMVNGGVTHEAGVIVMEFGSDATPSVQRWVSIGHQRNRGNISVWGDNAYLEMFLGDGLDTCNSCEWSASQFTVRDMRSGLGSRLFGARNADDTQTMGFGFPQDNLPIVGLSNPVPNNWKIPSTLPECRYETSSADGFEILQPGQMATYTDGVLVCTDQGLKRMVLEDVN